MIAWSGERSKVMGIIGKLMSLRAVGAFPTAWQSLID
jgi:hypothetical protein